MGQDVKRAISLALLFMSMIIISIIFSAVVYYIIDTEILSGKDLLSANNYQNGKEFFSRLFLILLIGLVLAGVFLRESTRHFVIHDRRALIILLLFILGAGSALGDPFHAVRAEENVIRYWTAGVLAAAGAIALVSSFNPAHPLPDRLFGGPFGLLLLAAASDELLQFHETGGQERVDLFLLSEWNLSGQDIATLGAAVFAVLVLLSAIIIWRITPWIREMLRGGRYKRVYYLFSLSVVVFLAAMLLDSFDQYIANFVDSLSTAILGAAGSPTKAAPFVTAAANSLEELLEYSAALCLLMTVATLYSIRTMGCNQPAEAR
jgi:hypothetical protein